MSVMRKIKLWTLFIMIGILEIGPFYYCTYGHCGGRTASAKLMKERPLHPGYPLIFDVRGRIDRLSKKEVVIDDSLFKLSGNIRYHTPRHNGRRRGGFRVGDFVGLKLDPDGEVVSIWFIRPHP